MDTQMDGLITFYASHHAMRADKVLREAGFAVALIPGPRELSPNCGVALRYEYARTEEALALLERSRVQIEAVHEYRPRVAEWTGTQEAPQAPATRSRFAAFWKR